MILKTEFKLFVIGFSTFGVLDGLFTGNSPKFFGFLGLGILYCILYKFHTNP